MSLISAAMSNHIENGSWIRRMFEAGIQLKQQYGEAAVCDFSLGNPDLPPPPAVGEGLRALAEKVQEPFSLGYMPNAGYGWARERLAEHLSKELHAPLRAGDVILTCGAAGALNVLFKSVLEPGDEVLSLAPYFVEYGFYVGNHGGVFRTVQTTSDFRPDFEALEKALGPKTRALIINSPNNPTGTVYTTEELERIVALLDAASRRNGRPVFLVSDEPYRFLCYGGQVPSVLPMYNYAVVASSFSKNLSLAGERLGYLALSPAMPDSGTLMAALTMANRILGFVNPPVVAQHLMNAALGTQVDASVYARRRELMAGVLREAGYAFILPAGAFYFFPPAPGGDDVAFTNALLEERILAVPGRGFGGPGYFRLAFCVQEEVILRSAEGFARARHKFA